MQTGVHWIVNLGMVAMLAVATCDCAAGDDPPGKQKDRPANRLAKETSPYLLLHAHNPVDWYPWGPEAFAKAKAENKPIFLSVGYSSCYWCHVMERESFMDAEIAKVLNAGFVCIKVDREERPDVDQIYMAAPSGARPRRLADVDVPDARRPPVLRRDVFSAARSRWVAGVPDDRHRSGQGLGQRPRRHRQGRRRRDRGPARPAQGGREARERRFRRGPPSRRARPSSPSSSTPSTAASASIPQIPSAPSSPSRSIWSSCSISIGAAGRPAAAVPALEMVTFTLDQMARGGIRDHLGGGYHRYSTDRYWIVPHFEKMLYDNAQLASVHLAAFEITKDPRWRAEAEATFRFVEEK